MLVDLCFLLAFPTGLPSDLRYEDMVVVGGVPPAHSRVSGRVQCFLALRVARLLLHDGSSAA